MTRRCDSCVVRFIGTCSRSSRDHDSDGLEISCLDKLESDGVEHLRRRRRPLFAVPLERLAQQPLGFKLHVGAQNLGVAGGQSVSDSNRGRQGGSTRSGGRGLGRSGGRSRGSGRCTRRRRGRRRRSVRRLLRSLPGRQIRCRQQHALVHLVHGFDASVAHARGDGGHQRLLRRVSLVHREEVRLLGRRGILQQQAQHAHQIEHVYGGYDVLAVADERQTLVGGAARASRGLFSRVHPRVLEQVVEVVLAVAVQHACRDDHGDHGVVSRGRQHDGL